MFTAQLSTSFWLLSKHPTAGAEGGHLTSSPEPLRMSSQLNRILNCNEAENECLTFSFHQARTVKEWPTRDYISTQAPGRCERMGTLRPAPDFGTRTSCTAMTPFPTLGLAGSLLSSVTHSVQRDICIRCCHIPAWIPSCFSAILSHTTFKVQRTL